MGNNSLSQETDTLTVIKKEVRFAAISCLCVNVIVAIPCFIFYKELKSIILGSALGTIFTVVSFFFLAMVFNKALDLNKAAVMRYVVTAYTFRISFVLIIILIAVLYNKVNAVTMIAPLFAPKLGYTVQGLLLKTKQNS